MSVEKLEKPDPGENYRLLEKSPVEALKPGDEYFVGGTILWYRSDNAEFGGVQETCAWYRRKIEPVNPKFAVGQRVKIIGPKTKPCTHWIGEMDQHIGRVDVVERVHVYGDKSIFVHLRGVKKFDFREDYLEPAVEPNPKFAVGQRVRVVRPKQKPSQNGGSDIDEFFGYADIVASVRENGEKLISYVLEGIDERAFPEDYLEPVVEPVEAKRPGHPMCRCYVDPAILKPAQAEPNVLYPKIGDVIFLPEVGRLRVTARGFDIA